MKENRKKTPPGVNDINFHSVTKEHKMPKFFKSV